ncbi:MAG: hypothetical protein Q9181_004457 [Wetmoreana brouardii]
MLEVRVPYVPKYVPSVEPPRNAILGQLTAIDKPISGRHATIISRFTKNNGEIGFTIDAGFKTKAGVDGTDERDVDLVNIYDYATPAELERFEHYEWELQYERERRKPKVGRPRKRLPTSDESASMDGVFTKFKKPLGRPRKTKRSLKAVDSPDQAARRSSRAAFAGVHISSPLKPNQMPSRATSPGSTAASLARSAESTKSSAHKSTSDMAEAPTRSLDGNSPPIPTAFVSSTHVFLDPSLNVDQLTSLNACKVVGDKSFTLDDDPSKPTRAPYAMVQAALSESEVSVAEDVAPDSESEDELIAAVSSNGRRFVPGKEIRTTPSVVAGQRRSYQVSLSDQETSEGLAQKESTSITPVRTKGARKSMTPHYPSATKLPKPARGRRPTNRAHRDKVLRVSSQGLLARDRSEIDSLLKKRPDSKAVGIRGGEVPQPRALHLSPQLVLGSPITSSDEEEDHRLRPAQTTSVSEKHHIILGSPITTSSDESNQGPRSARTSSPPSRARKSPTADDTKRRRSSERDERESWYRMVRR